MTQATTRKPRTDKYGRIILSPGPGHRERYLAMQGPDGIWRAGIEYRGQYNHDSEWCDVTTHATRQEAIDQLHTLAGKELM